MSTTQQSSGAGAATLAPALEVRDLSLRIGGAQILEDISFTVPAGQVVGSSAPTVPARPRCST